MTIHHSTLITPSNKKPQLQNTLANQLLKGLKCGLSGSDKRMQGIVYYVVHLLRTSRIMSNDTSRDPNLQGITIGKSIYANLLLTLAEVGMLYL